MSIALLVARLILGLGLSAHGAQKLFGWFGGYGPAGTGGFFENSLGFRPGIAFAVAAGLGEFLGGLLVATGSLGPIGPGLMIVVMMTAILTVHFGKPFFVDKGGPELPLMYAAGALTFAFVGFGAYSLDSALGLNILASDGARWIVVGIAVVLGCINYAISKMPGSRPVPVP
ncbi:MAG TPA: DoxX family protein [Candidatus Rubrimentiphilum sp.]|nr:DoxX family protein [Candidatus Rubrimentiphilum sp.]